MATIAPQDEVMDKPDDKILADMVYRFFKVYPPDQMDKSNKKYIKRIRDLSANETFIVEIDYHDISNFYYSLEPHSHDRKTFAWVMDDISKNPFGALKYFKNAVAMVIDRDLNADILDDDTKIAIEENNYSVYISNFASNISVSDIDSTYIGKLKKTKGVVLGYNDDVLIKVISSTWICNNCENRSKMRGGNAPKTCPQCDTNSGFVQDYTDQETIDCLSFTIQEPFDNKGIENDTVSMIKKYVRIEGKSLVNHFKNTIRPGATIEITGIIVLSQKRIPIGTDQKTYNMAKTEIFALYIDNRNDDSYHYNDELQDIIHRYVKPEKVSLHVKKILNSVAPHIYGHAIIKLALLLMLVEGVPMVINGSRIRGSIHLCLIGSPGEAKTEFGKTLLKLSPNSIYVQADATSGVGLTSAVMPPDETGSRTIELGALPLANGSHVFVEEADKSKNKDDMNSLSSALDDSQVIVPRKGGLIAELPTQCGCLFAANPEGGRDWDPTKDILEQTNFPTWFLSRMDLIFINKKTTDKSVQKKILEHRINNLITAKKESDYKEERKNNNPFSPTKLLAIQKMFEEDNYTGLYDYDYLVNEIHYLKTHYSPVLPENSEAYSKMIEFITNTPPMQIVNKDGSISTYSLVDNRTINSLIRLALASARLHRRHSVMKEDADIAIALLQASMSTRLIETPSLATNASNEANVFFSPKLTNQLLKLVEATQKAENIRFNSILKSLSHRARVFNKALIKMGALKCSMCNGIGSITDFGTKSKYRCDDCNGSGMIAKEFDRYMIEQEIFSSREASPFTSVDEINIFFNRYEKLGYIEKGKYGNIYTLVGDLNDSFIQRNIDRFIKEVTNIMYEKEMKEQERQMIKKHGGATASTMTTAYDDLNNNKDKKS